MWRSKKFIIVAVLAVVLLAGSIGGIALAADNGDDSQPNAKCGALLDKVGEIYNANPDRPGDIDCALLKAAFAQATSEMRPKVMQDRPKMGLEAMQDWLQNLAQQGKITEEQANEYLERWQSRPNTEQFEQQLKDWQQARPAIPPELKEWQEVRPELPFGFGFKDHGRFPGKGGLCAPAGE